MRPLGPESSDLGASDPRSGEDQADPLVSLDEAARILGTSHQTIWRVLQLAGVRPRRVTWGEKNVTAVTTSELSRVREVVLGGSGAGGVPQQPLNMGSRSDSVWLRAADLEAENADLKFRNEVIEGQLAQAERLARETTGSAGRAQDEIRSLELQRDRSEALRESLEGDLQRATEELEQLRSRLEAPDELEQLRKRLAEAEEGRDRLARELELAQVVEKSAQRRCDLLEEKLARLQREVEDSAAKSDGAAPA